MIRVRIKGSCANMANVTGDSKKSKGAQVSEHLRERRLWICEMH